MIQQHTLHFIVAMILIFFAATTSAQTKVVYPDYSSAVNVQQSDIVELLAAALKTTEARFGPASISVSPLKMNEERAMAELKANDLINVAWGATSEKLEQDFIPVRIPLRKGISGFRIALIDKSRQASFDKIQTLDDLRQFQIGSAFGWIDAGVLRANQMQVVEANYDALFAMTVHDRFDLFPIAINEAFGEYDAHHSAFMNLAVEERIVLYFPAPCYFFINKNSPALAERLRVGLEQLIDNGTFNRIFAKYNNAALQRADLQHRRVLVLDNPSLPKETPLDARYWLFPALLKSGANLNVKALPKSP